MNANEEIYYDTLVLASGSVLRTLNIPGSDAAGIFYLRDFKHALKIKESVQDKKGVVIVGAGFIGLELASTFSQMGANVQVIELEKYPLGRVLGEEVSRYFVDMHETHGVNFYLGEGIKLFEKDADGAIAAAITSTDKKIDSQMAIIGIGVTPNTSLSHPDLKVNRGYVVNEFGETSLPDVYAAGDCTVWPYKEKLIHIGHWEHAYHHGQTIAKNIIEPKSTPYTVLPYFWTDQYNQTFEYFGHTLSWDRTIVRGSLNSREFTVAYVDETNHPLAILSANKTDKRKDITTFMNSNQSINETNFKDLTRPLND